MELHHFLARTTTLITPAASEQARNSWPSLDDIRQTGRRSVQMVRRYIRKGSLFHDNTGAKLGLLCMSQVA